MSKIIADAPRSCRANATLRQNLRNPGRLVLSILLLCTLGRGQTSSSLPTLPLNEVWRGPLSSGGYMSTVLASELEEFKSLSLFPRPEIKNNSDGQIWYIANTQAAGTVPLWRHYQSSSGDHLDSLNQNEPGYVTNEFLGYVWSSLTAFPESTAEVVVASNGKYHASIRPDEIISGYSALNPLGVYGLERYNQNQIILLSLSAGGISVESNKVAGGVVWNWTWNGKAFVDSENQANLGQQMQSALFYYPTGQNQQNPTEAGDNYSGTSDPELSHGSPAMDFYNSGDSQITNSVPLDFMPTNWGEERTRPSFTQAF